jgi:hypothetical protein
MPDKRKHHRVGKTSTKPNFAGLINETGFYKILKKFLSIHRGKEIKNLLPGSVLVIVEVFI